MCSVITLRNTQRIIRFAEIIRSAYGCDEDRQFDFLRFIPSMGGLFEINNSQGYKARICRVDNNDNAYFKVSTGRESTEAAQRSLVAHCIGHAVLHLGVGWDDHGLVDQGVYLDAVMHRVNHMLEDWEADLFGDALTMPKAAFQQYAAGVYHAGGYDVIDIAAHFGVTKESVIRYGRTLFLFGTVRNYVARP